MYLRDIAVYADEQIVERFPSGFVGWFHRESCCITELYRSVLGKRVATPDTAKVNLCFMEKAGFAPTVKQLMDVSDAQWEFDLSRYANQDVDDKRQMIFDALHAALLWIATQRKWDTKGFEECRTEIILRNLKFGGWSKKSWVSPNPKFRAKVGFSFGLRAVEFYVGVFDRRGREMGRKPLGSVVREMGVAHSVLKSPGRWSKGGVFRLQIARAQSYLPNSWQVDLSELLA